MSLWQKFFLKFTQNTHAMPLVEEMAATACLGDLAETKIFIASKKMQPAKEALPAILKVVSGMDVNKTLELTGCRINIGRLVGSELFLTDTGVSRLHAFIVVEDGKHVIYDGKSMNGTYVNGLRISKKVLQHGDSIKVANTAIIYEFN